MFIARLCFGISFAAILFAPCCCLPEGVRHHRLAAVFADKVHSAPAFAPLPHSFAAFGYGVEYLCLLRTVHFFGRRCAAKRRLFTPEGIPVYQAGRREALGRAGFKPPKAGGALSSKRKKRDSRGFVPRRLCRVGGGAWI